MRLGDIRNLGFATRSLLLSLAVLAVLAVAAPVGWALYEVSGLAAAAVAAACCWFGAMAALAACEFFYSQKMVLPGVLAGMFFRMAIPLGMAAAIHIRGGPLAEAGFLYYLLLFYPVTLGVETVLSLPRTEVPHAAPKSPQKLVS